MRIILRDGWPYQPPQISVDGIRSWHADHDRLCLWQHGDDTRAWVSFEGILSRIDEWVADAHNDFSRLGPSLDPHLYFAPLGDLTIGVDVEALVAGAYQDGQHGFHHVRLRDQLVELAPGRPSATHPPDAGLEGRWFYRATLEAPPVDLMEFEAALTDNQHQRYEACLRRNRVAMQVLIWTTPHGHVPLIMRVDDGGPTRQAAACWPTPISIADRLRRAGPDAQGLQKKRVVIFGVGAIGSHLAALFARSGLGHLTLVDRDTIMPVGQVRHAAAAERVNDHKPAAMKHTLRHFAWTTIETDHRLPWAPSQLRDRIEGFDLVVDATGLTPFAELLGRVAATRGIPLVSVALYRGGAAIRVRRQAGGDTPLTERRGHWRYPAIPPGDPTRDYVGVEVGCVAPIHNAPPAAVEHAAVLAVDTSVDWLTGRRQLPDERIEIRTPLEPPFNRRGPLTVARPSLQVTDAAAAAMRTAAEAARPSETGGILVGVHDEAGRPLVISAIELPATSPSTNGYKVAKGATGKAIATARKLDPRVGYLGEWHSHPSNQPASPTDRKTMANLADDPETGIPALVIVRPTSRGFQLDAYIADDVTLAPVDIVAVGPLPEADGSA